MNPEKISIHPTPLANEETINFEEIELGSDQSSQISNKFINPEFNKNEVKRNWLSGKFEHWSKSEAIGTLRKNIFIKVIILALLLIALGAGSWIFSRYFKVGMVDQTIPTVFDNGSTTLDGTRLQINVPLTVSDTTQLTILKVTDNAEFQAEVNFLQGIQIIGNTNIDGNLEVTGTINGLNLKEMISNLQSNLSLLNNTNVVTNPSDATGIKGDIAQAGNSFGTNMVIGTNDTFGLKLQTNSTTRIDIQSDGDIDLDNGTLIIDNVNNKLIVKDSEPSSDSLVATSSNTSLTFQIDSFALTSNDLARFNMYDNNTDETFFVACTNADCTTRNETSLGVGTYTEEIVLTSNDLVRFGMYDNNTDETFFVACTNADCTTRNETLLGTNTYIYNITLTSNNLARFAYHDNNTDETFFVACTNADCTTRNETLLGTNVNIEDLALNSNNLARLSIYDGNTDQAYFVACTNADCTTRDETSLGAGTYIEEMVLTSNDLARLSVYDDDINNYYFVACTNTDCTTRDETSLGSNIYISMINLTSNNLARFSLENYDTDESYFVACTNADCTTRNETLMGTNVNIEDLALNSNNLARIITRNYNSNEFKFMACINAECSNRDETLLLTGNINITQLSLTSDNFARIVYYDNNASESYFYACITADCGRTISGTNIGTEDDRFANIYSTSVDTEYFNLQSSVDMNQAFSVSSSDGEQIFNIDTSEKSVAVSGELFTVNAGDGTNVLSVASEEKSVSVQGQLAVIGPWASETPAGEDAPVILSVQGGWGGDGSDTLQAGNGADISISGGYGGIDRGVAGGGRGGNVSISAGSAAMGMWMVRYAQCINADCTTKSVNPLAVDASGYNYNFDSSGTTHRIYTASNTLKYEVCGNSDCSTLSSVATITNRTPISNLAIDNNGYGRFIMLATFPHERIYVQCTNVDCSTYTTITYGTSNGWSSSNTYSIDIDSLNLAHFIDYDHDSSESRYIQCTNLDCSNRNTTLLHTGAANYIRAFALDASDLGRYLYTDSGTNNLIHVQCLNADCSSRNSTIIVTSGYSFKLDIDSTNLTRFIYYNNSNSDLVYVQCLNADCSSRNTTVIDGTAYHTDGFALDSNDLGHIVYFDPNPTPRNIVYVRCLNADCSSRNTNNVYATQNYTYDMKLKIASDDTGRFMFRAFSDGVSGGELTLSSGYASGYAKGGDLRITTGGSSDGIAGTLRLQTGSGTSGYASLVLQDSGGYVGIGATDPDAKLTVVAPNDTSSQIRLRSNRSAITTGEVIGGIDFMSNDTNITVPGAIGARIQAVASATHTAAVQSTDIVFSTVSGTTMLEVMRLTSAGNLVVRSATINGHIITGNTSGTTTIVAGAAACTTPTVSVSGNDTAGSITVTTGTGCAATGILGTISFSSSFATAPRINLTPGNAAAATLNYYRGSATGNFTLNTSTIPTNSTTYIYDYHILQ